jgi:hypothetical protein
MLSGTASITNTGPNGSTLLIPQPVPYVCCPPLACLPNTPYNTITPPKFLGLMSDGFKKLRGFGPQANYTDRATTACRRS